MSTLERAIAIAAEAHAGQVDKAGQPYILHPLRVMMAVPPEAKIPAVLHDVVEDCPEWTFERLEAEGFHPIALSALDAVTRRTGESYEAFIERSALNAIGRVVKMADLTDNLNPARMSMAPAAHNHRPRYEAALHRLARHPIPAERREAAGSAVVGALWMWTAL